MIDFSRNLSLGTDQKFHGNTLYYPPSRFGLLYTLESHTPSTFSKICIFSTRLGLRGKELHPRKEKETKGCGNEIIDPLLFNVCNSYVLFFLLFTNAQMKDWYLFFLSGLDTMRAASR